MAEFIVEISCDDKSCGVFKRHVNWACPPKKNFVYMFPVGDTDAIINGYISWNADGFSVFGVLNSDEESVDYWVSVLEDNGFKRT